MLRCEPHREADQDGPGDPVEHTSDAGPFEHGPRPGDPEARPSTRTQRAPSRSRSVRAYRPR
jgi:hypothetical protein